MAHDACTIFALSSGAPPAAIGIIRVSGPDAAATLVALGGRLPEPRRATLRVVRDPADGSMLDRALLLWFPGPATATGEDLAELHVHGGRAVVAAVLMALSTCRGLRPAAPGEFTRRALTNGRIDLAEVEGLGDLLSAETETQRRAALFGATGHLSRQIEQWRAQLLGIIASNEAVIEFSDEDDGIAHVPIATELGRLIASIADSLASPPSERIRDGIRVVIAGPPNAGKSSLLNALAGRDAALVSEIAGTTRDVIEAPVVIEGLPFLLCDTAGIRESNDAVERLGVAATQRQIAQADVLLWLGEADAAPDHDRCIRVATKVDILRADSVTDVQTSAVSGAGLTQLRDILSARTEPLLRGNGSGLTSRQRYTMGLVTIDLERARRVDDQLIAAEYMRAALRELGTITAGGGDAEDTLSAIFSRFCVGK